MEKKHQILKTKESRLLLVFAGILTGFLLILLGAASSRMWICEAAMVLLLGSLLYSPLQKVAGCWKNFGRKEEADGD
ncbi:MAG: hypothetical protein HFE84_06630 [Lachnospiraceae bacterium]|nr:hypothetical protein [Lachnospiraceae bacterium]